jgi:hypothetical protein
MPPHLLPCITLAIVSCTVLLPNAAAELALTTISHAPIPHILLDGEEQADGDGDGELEAEGEEEVGRRWWEAR